MMSALYWLLILGAMMLAGHVSAARGRALGVSLLALAWPVGQLSILIEAALFGVMPPRDAAVQAMLMLGAFALLAGIAIVLLGKSRGEASTPVAPRVTVPRLLAVIAGYAVLYFAAGMIAYPFVAHFYRPDMLPNLGVLAGMQVARALIFAAAAWPWLCTGPRHAPWVLGLVFSVIGGIAPLLPDNPYMPADVRFVHAIEVGVSNFLFGMLVAYLLRPRIRGA